MTPKKFKTRTVSRERSGTYLKKAGEFFRASELGPPAELFRRSQRARAVLNHHRPDLRRSKVFLPIPGSGTADPAKSILSGRAP